VATYDGPVTLYRRFRPGRFSEIRGQEHVVSALRNAVAKDRVVNAYLFSGPRGTGKTSTARILAKALNCEVLNEGDPCNACASCISITQGTSFDVVELDAASNSGVEDIRDLLEGVWMGTGGRTKVYIIDEVHALSDKANYALLKTLEETPPHVVFVLATTDPHKVLPTVRSRTQHLEFRLLAPDVMRDLLVDVREKAALEVGEDIIDAALRDGKGSARDALSALDRYVAAGFVGDGLGNLDPLLEALAANDAPGAIASLAALIRSGEEAREVAERLVNEMRQVFLLMVSPDIADAFGGERERLALWGQRLGLPKTVRIMETIGRSARDMNQSVDATIVLEVNLARLTHPELDDNIAALAERLTALERKVASGPVAAPAAPLPKIGAGRRPAAETPAPAPVAQTPAAPAAREVTPVAARPQPVVADEVATPAPTAVTLATVQAVLAAGLPVARSVSAVLAGATATELRGDTLVVAVRSELAKKNLLDVAGAIIGSLRVKTGAHLSLEVVVNADLAPTVSEAPIIDTSKITVIEGAHEDEVFEESAVTMEGDSVTESSILDQFPGATELR